eukprot:scaffold2455_cov387-Prasinococcus_capsulatus_cf.AAC.2
MAPSESISISADLCYELLFLIAAPGALGGCVRVVVVVIPLTTYASGRQRHSSWLMITDMHSTCIDRDPPHEVYR